MPLEGQIAKEVSKDTSNFSTFLSQTSKQWTDQEQPADIILSITASFFYIGVNIAVSGEQERDSATYMRLSIFSQIPLPSRLHVMLSRAPCAIMGGPCGLPILNLAVYMRPSQTPKLSLSPAALSSFSKSVSRFPVL